MLGSVNSIETFGLVDGPGIRTVVFLNGCKLRCKYCHNPEMWSMKEGNTPPEELVKKLLRYKPYFKRNNGGVTFSGGEPLLQSKFLIEVCKLLKEEDVHIVLDTSGVGNGDYFEVLSYVDLVLFDIKQITEDGYLDITGLAMDESLKFIEVLNQLKKPVWIRQVIVPGIMDQENYLVGLVKFLSKFHEVERVDFLPYHKMGEEKYKALNLEYTYSNIPEMNKEECEKLYDKFMELWGQMKN